MDVWGFLSFDVLGIGSEISTTQFLGSHMLVLNRNDLTGSFVAGFSSCLRRCSRSCRKDKSRPKKYALWWRYRLLHISEILRKNNYFEYSDFRLYLIFVKDIDPWKKSLPIALMCASQICCDEWSSSALLSCLFSQGFILDNNGCWLLSSRSVRSLFFSRWST